MKTAIGIAVAAVLTAGCGYPEPPASDQGPVAGVGAATPSPTAAAVDDFNAGTGQTPITLPDGLKYIDLKVGDGAFATGGASVSMQYTGWLTNGTKFDSSRDRQQPFDFAVGGGQVIKGWDEGIPGMRVGGKRKLIIPPDLGYADKAQGSIPANSTLVFAVELVGVKPAGTPKPSP